MNQNWCKGKAPYPELAIEMATIQCNLHGSVVLIDNYNEKLCNKHLISRLKKYTEYRIGERK